MFLQAPHNGNLFYDLRVCNSIYFNDSGKKICLNYNNEVTDDIELRYGKSGKDDDYKAVKDKVMNYIRYHGYISTNGEGIGQHRSFTYEC